MELWEILIPQADNEGMVFELSHHNTFDEFVRRYAGGYTIFRSAAGYWELPPEGGIYRERMIPVRIFCDSAAIERIACFAKNHYDQKVVMYYLISRDVYFLDYDCEPE